MNRAAISAVDAPHTIPDIGCVSAYAAVVEALHARQTVLPLRYGCVARDEDQVSTLLLAHQQEYGDALRELEGCVEMGVRVLVPPEPEPLPLPEIVEKTGLSGQAYLGLRGAHYRREEERVRAWTQTAQRLRDTLGVHARRTTTGMGEGVDRRPASLCFLLDRTQLAAFRREFRRLESATPTRLMLSGPWPPYSFVCDLSVGATHD